MPILLGRPSARLLAVSLGVATLLAAGRARSRDDDACPLEEGCTEACELPVASQEQPSPAFLAKLKSAATAGHRVEARLAPSLYERRSWLGVINAAGLTSDLAKLWEVDRHYAGPCSGL